MHQTSSIPQHLGNGKFWPLQYVASRCTYPFEQIFLDVKVIEDRLSRIADSTQRKFFLTRFIKLTAMYEELSDLLANYASGLDDVVSQRNDNSAKLIVRRCSSNPALKLATDFETLHPPRPGTPASVFSESPTLTRPRFQMVRKFFKGRLPSSFRSKKGRT